MFKGQTENYQELSQKIQPQSRGYKIRKNMNISKLSKLTSFPQSMRIFKNKNGASKPSKSVFIPKLSII